MPNVNLPTGANLYYETHGQGEPLVLIPSTGFSAEAWKPSQLPLAESTNLILHDPRGCGRSVAAQQVYTINQMANDIVACSIICKFPRPISAAIPWVGELRWKQRSIFPEGLRV